ncbi:MAG: ADP-dependent NAD(P)H-hydrate dehydratase / NAD(P)H-hydrate epimerase [Actinomycetota bacterium]|nr:ADP-dependent NAD(P)H-hydrate dehydratase / NAD(P)H-hydrate epimerase [Actinomycetota bacterium]
MKQALTVSAVREAEAAALAATPDGALMDRAAAGLAVISARWLQARRGGVSGSSVAVLAGAGNNGGDALFAAARLGARGARVRVYALSESLHPLGAAAVLRSGGQIVNLAGLDPDSPVSVAAAEVVAAADLVLDGIVGIGGRGPLRPVAAELARAARGRVIAVDLPSGVDPDTGAVADVDACVAAEMTVTFGVLKTGLLLPPAARLAGLVSLVDIGLQPYLAGAPDALLMDLPTAGAAVPTPTASDDKYTRGVLGVVAGSEQYPGAGILCSGSARFGGVGMVRYAGGARASVVTRWPEVVPSSELPSAAGQAQAWVIGPGAGVDQVARDRLADAVALEVPIVVDADAITLIAGSAELRAALAARKAPTLLTPHEGEFARLGGDLSTPGGRLAAVRRLADELCSVILLKGAVTLVSGATGTAMVSASGPPDLATAGSGDVLAGLVGSMVAANAVADDGEMARVAAAAAYLHGVAGRLAAADGRPIVSEDVLNSVPAAIALARSGEVSG